MDEINAIQHEYQRLQFDNREMSLKLEDLRSDRVEKIKRKCAKRKTSRLFVKTMTGTTMTIDLILDRHTVADLADVYSQRVGIPANQRIRLIFAGRQLEHDKVLSYYNIQNESTLHNVLNLRGD